MAKLLHAGTTSLDGYIADAEGNFDWSAPDDEVHGFVNDLESTVGTCLCGRRLYEVMKVWEDVVSRTEAIPLVEARRRSDRDRATAICIDTKPKAALEGDQRPRPGTVTPAMSVHAGRIRAKRRDDVV